MTTAEETALALPYRVVTLTASIHGPAGTCIVRCATLDTADRVASAFGGCEVARDGDVKPCIMDGDDPRACSCATCKTPEQCEPSASAIACCPRDEAERTEGEG